MIHSTLRKTILRFSRAFTCGTQFWPHCLAASIAICCHFDCFCAAVSNRSAQSCDRTYSAQFRRRRSRPPFARSDPCFSLLGLLVRPIRHFSGGVSASCNFLNPISSLPRSTISAVISRPRPLKITSFSPTLMRRTSRASLCFCPS